jgi:hypothetical protein
VDIKFDTDKLVQLDMSYYNHNYYKLPYTIEGCDTLFEHWEDDDLTGEFNLGVIENGKFVEKLKFFGDSDGNVNMLTTRII